MYHTKHITACGTRGKHTPLKLPPQSNFWRISSMRRSLRRPPLKSSAINFMLPIFCLCGGRGYRPHRQMVSSPSDRKSTDFPFSDGLRDGLFGKPWHGLVHAHTTVWVPPPQHVARTWLMGGGGDRVWVVWTTQLNPFWGGYPKCQPLKNGVND